MKRLANPIRFIGRIYLLHGTGQRSMEIHMTDVQVKQAVRLQKAAKKQTKLTYRGVAYLLAR